MVNSEDLGLCSEFTSRIIFPLQQAAVPLSVWIVAIRFTACEHQLLTFNVAPVWIVAIRSHVNISFSHIQCGPWTAARGAVPSFCLLLYFKAEC